MLALDASDTNRDWDLSSWIFWLGMFGQACFFCRFLVQWLATERARRVVVPRSFWYMSIAGALLMIFYGICRKDTVIIVGQMPGTLVYLRNLYFGRLDSDQPAP